MGVCDNVRVEAFDDSTVIARGKAIVFGHDSSRVEAGEEVFVRLFDKSDAKVFGNVEVRAEDNSGDKGRRPRFGRGPGPLLSLAHMTMCQ